MNRDVCSDLQRWLIQKLDIGARDAPQRLAELISQDAEIMATRSKLEAECLKLKDIQKELRNLEIYSDVGNFGLNKGQSSNNPSDSLRADEASRRFADDDSSSH